MNNFNFNRDFYEGCRALGDREGMALAWAMLRYGYEGIEPKLKPTTMAAFTFARGRIDAMVNGSLGGKARAAKAGGCAATQGGSQGGCLPSRREGSQQKEKEKEIALADPPRLPLTMASMRPLAKVNAAMVVGFSLGSTPS